MYSTLYSFGREVLLPLDQYFRDFMLTILSYESSDPIGHVKGIKAFLCPSTWQVREESFYMVYPRCFTTFGLSLRKCEQEWMYANQPSTPLTIRSGFAKRCVPLRRCHGRIVNSVVKGTKSTLLLIWFDFDFFSCFVVVVLRERDRQTDLLIYLQKISTSKTTVTICGPEWETTIRPAFR